MLSQLTTELIGTDLDAVLQLVIHLKDIQKTLDPLIELLKTLIPLLSEVSKVLGIVGKIL